MQKAHSLTDVNRIMIEEFMPSTSMKERYSLDRMHALMQLLGNPQNQLKIVHVAGTSGKTSTCYYTSALLHATGQKVGLTVSPHVDEINERVQINGRPLAEKKFCAYFNEFTGITGLVELQASYFEIMVAFAFWVFAQEHVDYAVIEVGIGGLGDATNVIDRQDKVCVITDIGMDHTQILGNTLAKITRQKAGIIQEGNQIFMMEQGFAILDVVEEVAMARHAHLAVIPDEAPGFLRSLPPFMRRNWQLARAVTQYIAARDDLPELQLSSLTETVHITVPARMEVIEHGDKLIVLDGSHNQQKLSALHEGLQERFATWPRALLLSFTQDRLEILEEAVKSIAPGSEVAIVTSFETAQDSRHNSVALEAVADAARKAGAKEIVVAANPAEALDQLLDRPEPLLVVTGSFYLLNHIRPLLRSKKERA